MDVTVNIKLKVSELDLLRETVGNELETSNSSYKEGLIPLPERRKYAEKSGTLTYLHDVLMGKK
jgi:hypothetical protein